ncbi:MAG TPA: hypothetical protein VEQ11_04215 [Chloroflexota bacterium]|nr:hypothetical protein [Chloroflexota bacterium]
MSNEALGARPRRRLSARDRDRWRGVSHLSSLAAAITKARDSPWLGAYIAELRVSPQAPIRVEQTGRNPYHYTLWGDPGCCSPA